MCADERDQGLGLQDYAAAVGEDAMSDEEPWGEYDEDLDMDACSASVLGPALIFDDDLMSAPRSILDLE